MGHINVRNLTTESRLNLIEDFLCNDTNLDVMCMSEMETRRWGCRVRKRTYPCYKELDLEPPNVELVWVELVFQYKRILVGACYRPPTNGKQRLTDF